MTRPLIEVFDDLFNQRGDYAPRYRAAMPPIASPHRPRIAALLREYPRENAPQIVARLAAEGISLSPATVVRVARAEGLERRPGRPSESRGGQREAVLILSAEGLDPEEVAATLDCSRRLVLHYLQEARSATGNQEK